MRDKRLKEKEASRSRQGARDKKNNIRSFATENGSNLQSKMNERRLKRYGTESRSDGIRFEPTYFPVIPLLIRASVEQTNFSQILVYRYLEEGMEAISGLTPLVVLFLF